MAITYYNLSGRQALILVLRSKGGDTEIHGEDYCFNLCAPFSLLCGENMICRNYAAIEMAIS
jgi:hypothetical protein